MPLFSQQLRLLDDLRRRLQAVGYSAQSSKHLCSNARKFLQYLRERGIALEAVQPANVAMFMRRQLQDYRHRHGRSPNNRKAWRTWCTDGVVQLLRFSRPPWPPAPLPKNQGEVLAQTLCRDYRGWLADCRGLAASTIDGHLEETQRFLTWHLRHGGEQNRLRMSVRQIDEYLQL